MFQLHYQDGNNDHSVTARPGETVLDAFLRGGVEIPFSCRGGVCHVCLRRCDEGRIPVRAQRGLSEEQTAAGYFMPCKCIPVGDMRISAPDEQAAAAPPRPAAAPERPEPDPALWAALGQGVLLRTILEDFYSRVFVDPLLAPYFAKATRERLIEKQYSFVQQLVTGEKVYFGDRPRNAHHWMVISHELFDYRAEILLNCMREHGLDEAMARRWHALEERSRGDIVKETPWPKVVGGQELPLEGYEDLVMDCGALCDGCGGAIEAGEAIRYHVRLGTVYCARCGGASLTTAGQEALATEP
jgi:ferredoxin/truncated hemoglobin YjbI